MIKTQDEVISMMDAVRNDQIRISTALESGKSVNLEDVYKLVETIDEIIENVKHYSVLENNEADGEIAIRDFTKVRDGWANIISSFRGPIAGEEYTQWVN